MEVGLGTVVISEFEFECVSSLFGRWTIIADALSGGLTGTLIMGGASVRSPPPVVVEPFSSLANPPIDLFGPNESILVELFPCNNPSNSTSLGDGARGTCPTTYGRPFSVAAGFQCFLPEDEENSDGSRRREEDLIASCSRYSRGTNSSKRTSVIAVRGSVMPETVVLEGGSDLNSTYI